MSDALLERLVADGAITRADAGRVVARQEQAGGTLDSALLELRLVPAARLPGLLARASGLPAPPDRAFEAPDPRARRVFPAKVAERHGIAPFALDGRDLSIVTSYPPDTGLLDEIGFMLSLNLRPHVAPEWRVRKLVHDLYGTPVPERLASLAAAPERDPADDLPDADVGPESTRPAPSAPPSATPPPASAPPRGAPPPRDGLPSSAPGWTADEARSALAEARGRDEAIRVALRHARDFFAFAAVLSVRRDALVGHDALGVDPLAREACRRVVVPLGDPGLFGTPLATHAPYLGPPPPDPVTASVLSGMGRSTPHTVLAVPVFVGGRPACVLYADNDDAPVAASRLGGLFVVLGTLGATLERLVRERKAGSPAAAAGPEAETAPGSAPEPPPGPSAEPAPAPGSRTGLPVAPPRREAPEAAGISDARPAEEAVAPPAPESPAPSPQEPAGPDAPAVADGDEGWRVSEPARMEVSPLAFAVDVDLGEYEVATASEALATGRAADLPALVDELRASAPGSPARRAIVDRLLAGGAEAAAALVARLPGPPEGPATRGPDAPVEERGPIFAALVAVGMAAQKPLRAALGDSDAARRAAAVPLLARLGQEEALGAVTARLFDDDPRVAAESRAAVARWRGSPALGPVIADLRRALGSGVARRAIPASRALAALGDADAVPALIQALDDGGELAAAAAEALERITLQRLGADPIRWIAWWREWRAAPRASWLLEALHSPDREVRQLASDELRRAGEPPVTYVVDAPAPERDHAAKAWAAWWREEGLAL